MKNNFIKNITTKGVMPEMTPHEEKGVIITNYILLLAALVSFFRIFMFYVNYEIQFLIISISACILFLFAYFMNTKGYYDFAKFTTIITGNTAILIKELASGGTGNQLFLMIASYGVILLLFDHKHRVKIFFALLVPTICIAISIFSPNIPSALIVLNSNAAMLEKFFGALSAIIIIISVIRYFVNQSLISESKLIKSNEMLQNFNQEITAQKELIEANHMELQEFNKNILAQKKIIEEQHYELTSSIQYASTIQHAILPWDSTLAKAFGDIFVFFKPKDIVSGDSYWFQEVDGIKFLAVIDCTGHGIPGAMLTVIASSVLDDAVLSKKLHDTAQILTFMNNKVTEVLNQRLAENQIRDGMEVALIAIHQDKFQFSGAGRPLYMKNATFEIIKTDKRGIAGQVENDVYDFSSVEIEKSENMTLYLTTDGFADQMNEDGKKYSTKRFVSLLESISEKPIPEQNIILETEFNSHKGNREQIDDVTVLGVKI